LSEVRPAHWSGRSKPNGGFASYRVPTNFALFSNLVWRSEIRKMRMPQMMRVSESGDWSVKFNFRL
jgi:hypothetical protein